MNLSCITSLRAALAAKHPEAVLPADWSIPSELCPPGMKGDVTVNCFRFARNFSMRPDQLAAEVAELLKQSPDVSDAEAVKAFVNVTLTPAALFRDTVADMNALLAQAALPPEKRRRILVEYSAPNTNKPQHLGHVRNNTIGMSLCSLLSRVSHTVIPVNLVNDRGIHICKSMLAYQRFGNGATPESTGIKGDHFVGNFYVEYNKALSAELKQLRAEKPELAEKSDEELFLQTEIGAAAQKMLQDWENNDPDVRALWKTMNSWVFAGFAETYARMGIKFNKTYLESQTYLLGKDLVAKGLADGVFAKRGDGAVTVDLGKLGTKVVLRSDGTSVYITQDIGTTLLKYNEHHPDTQIWVVGDEQLLHFKMLFSILEKLGNPWAKNLQHLSYGMVNLPSGKMKSREGTVVDADDLFDEMHNLARTATVERLGEGAELPADLEERSEIIGMGALKFMLLKFNPKTTILFDPNASLKFEGDTGPYVQYVCARINSMERKAAERSISVNDPDWSLLGTGEERQLAMICAAYPDILRSAAEKMDCSVLIGHLLEIAKAFNRFYRECPVLAAESDALKQARLALSYAVRDILSDGLATLTIRVPDAM